MKSVLTQPSVEIVIVNWNAGIQLRECLQSIEGADVTGIDVCQITIVDNASTDGSAEGLESLRFPLKIIRNQSNLGYGKACNQAGLKSTADYLLFLNPDSRVFQETLVRAVGWFTRSEAVHTGILGVQLLDEHGRVVRSSTRFPTPKHFLIDMLGLARLFPRMFADHFMREWDHSSSREVDHVIGAFCLMRRPLFQELKGFDERFFMYLEDLDLSLRARKLGWRTFFLTEAQVYHKGGGSSAQVKARRLYYSLSSRILYGLKHFHPAPAVGLMLGTLILEPLIRLVWTLVRGSGTEFQETAIGFALLWRDTPQLLRRLVRGG